MSHEMKMLPFSLLSRSRKVGQRLFLVMKNRLSPLVRGTISSEGEIELLPSVEPAPLQMTMKAAPAGICQPGFPAAATRLMSA